MAANPASRPVGSPFERPAATALTAGLTARRVTNREVTGMKAIPRRLHAPIHAIYDVTEIKEAVAAAASGGRSGKILIVPRG